MNDEISGREPGLLQEFYITGSESGLSKLHKGNESHKFVSYSPLTPVFGSKYVSIAYDENYDVFVVGAVGQILRIGGVQFEDEDVSIIELGERLTGMIERGINPAYLSEIIRDLFLLRSNKNA